MSRTIEGKGQHSNLNATTTVAGKWAAPIRKDPDPIYQAVAALRPLWGANTHTLTERHASAVAVIYRCYASMLRSVAARIVRSDADAEDVVHDVFCKLPWVVGQYRDGGLGGWLKQVTVTTALMHIRKVRLRREEDLFDDYRCWPTANADFSLMRLEHGEELRWALRHLTEPLRRVVVMRFYLGYSHQEIANALGITPNASEVRLCRALKQLRHAIRSPFAARAAQRNALDESLGAAQAS